MNSTASCPVDTRRGYSLLLALALCAVFNAQADTTMLGVAGASKGASSTPVILTFPLTRSGDTSYDAVLSYHTVDGTAQAGIDYTAASGTITVPAGSTSATIPITLAANTGSATNQTFQLSIDTATGVGPAPDFAAQQTFTTGARPVSVTTADVNGDDKPDLIVANYNDNTVSVLLNTSALGAAKQTFATPVTFATGGGPISVTTSDVNGDGKPDLIVANHITNTVSVLLNTSAPGATIPSFVAQQTFATGSYPYSVTATDVNGDGKPDLIVANFGSNSVMVLLNTTASGAATLTFAAQQAFATGSAPDCVATADINGDGKPDLVVTNYSDATISVLLNTTTTGATTPTFAAQQTFATGSSNPYFVTPADINGDGKPDLIVANQNSSSVSVLLNTSTLGTTTPSFATEQAFATDFFPRSVSTADVNGDGKSDLIVANYGSLGHGNTVSVLINTTVPGAATPSFAAQQSFPTGNAPDSVSAADVNGDGKPDLIVANGNDNTVSVLLNIASPPAASANFAAQRNFAVGANPTSVIAEDVNCDGKPDLIVANYTTGYGNTVSVLLNATAPDAPMPSFGAQQTFVTGNGPYSVAAADVNGDSKSDLIVANYTDNTVSVLLNTTSPGATAPSFAAQQSFATGSHPFSVAAADVNGDGKPDLIVANQGDSTVSVLLNTTTAGAILPTFAVQQSFTTGPYSQAVAVIDVDGDGKPDLIIGNGDNTVSVLLNTTAPGATALSFATQQSFATTGSQSVITADVNSDGKPDLIVANTSSNTVSVLLNTTTPGAASPTFAAQESFGTDSWPYSVTAADVNGDGKPDLIVANIGSNTVSLLINTTVPGATTSSFAAQQTVAMGNAPNSITTADVNGDGKPDLIFEDGNRTVSVLLNTQYQVVIVGGPATGTIVHDYMFANGFD